MVRKELNEEQQSQWEDFIAQINNLDGLYTGLKFFEKKLGMVNKNVTEFRKILKIEEKEHLRLGEMNEKMGIVDIFAHNIGVSENESLLKNTYCWDMKNNKPHDCLIIGKTIVNCGWFDEDYNLTILGEKALKTLKKNNI